MDNLILQNSSDYAENLNNYCGNATVIIGEALEPPLYIVLTSTILYCFIFLVGVVGNILVTIVIVVSHSLKTTVNKYLLNLCIADVLVIMICMPTALADIYTKEVWYFGEFMYIIIKNLQGFPKNYMYSYSGLGKLIPFLENATANASVLTILAISIERYRVVCYPLTGVGENAVNVWKRVLIVWIISIVFSVPWLYIAILRPSTFHDGTPIQVCRNPIIKDWQKIYVVGLAFLFFFIPCLLMMLLYCHLCKVLNRTREYDACIHENRRDRKLKQHQVANSIASIVFIFFICHLPFRVAVLWFSFEDKNVIWGLGLEKFLLILYSTRIMFYTNHALNPVVYNFVSSKFRSALRVCCRRASLKSCFSFTSVYRRQSSRATFRSTRSLTAQQSNRIGGRNQIILGQLEEAGARNIPRRVLVEYPCNGHTPKKLLVTKCPSSNLQDSSSTSGDGYKVRIQIEDQSVAIKFKLKRLPE